MSVVVKLVIKNPANHDSFTLSVSPDATIAEVQRLLSISYGGNPPASHQTLIFAGKVLKDLTVTIRQLIEKHEPFEGPHSFHLVVKAKDLRQPAIGAETASAAVASMAPTSQAAAAPASAPAPAPAPVPIPTASASMDAGPALDTNSHSNEAGTPGPSFQTGPFSTEQYSPQMHLHPVYAAAYQAAYAAAITASASAQPDTSSMAPIMPMGCYMPVMMMPQAYFPMMQNSMQSFMQQHQQAHQQQVHHHSSTTTTIQFTPPPALAAQLLQAGALNNQDVRIEGLPQDLAMAVLANFRLRGRGGAADGQAGGQPGQQMGGIQLLNVPRPRRLRVNVRLSIRTILQVLIFAMVIYQHYTWNRFMALLAGGFVMYLAASWGPLRRAVAGLQQPPPQPQRPVVVPPPAPARAQAGAGQAAEGMPQPQPAQAGHEAAAAAAAPVAHQPRARGFFNEVLVIVLGFITSLLPAWNYNPDDAAAFAAGEAIAAREDREVQPQAGLGVAANGNEGAAAEPPGGQAPAAEVEPVAVA